MKDIIFEGCGVATITPMKKDGSVNLKKYAELIDYLIENHADAIIVNGTTGENPTLSDEEQYNIICCAKDTINRRVPLIAGAGSNDTKHAARLALNARNAGADAILTVTPYYNKTNDEGLIAHFNFVAEHCGLPMILYNVPSRTGVNISPKVCYELSKNPLINSVKEASGNIAQCAKIKELCGDELNIYSGNDDCIVPILSLGGKGVISVLGNLLPNAVHEMCKNYFDGFTEKSLILQLKYLPLINALFSDVNPIPVKEAMNIVGFDAGNPRLPLTELNENKKKELCDILKSYDLI